MAERARRATASAAGSTAQTDVCRASITAHVVLGRCTFSPINLSIDVLLSERVDV
jgi:hypothetical protein